MLIYRILEGKIRLGVALLPWLVGVFETCPVLMTVSDHHNLPGRHWMDGSQGSSLQGQHFMPGRNPGH